MQVYGDSQSFGHGYFQSVIWCQLDLIEFLEYIEQVTVYSQI